MRLKIRIYGTCIYHGIQAPVTIDGITIGSSSYDTSVMCMSMYNEGNMAQYLIMELCVTFVRMLTQWIRPTDRQTHIQMNFHQTNKINVGFPYTHLQL